MSRRSALGRSLGLGSAKEGTDHWWSQRVSAVALIALAPWFAFSMVTLIGGGAGHAELVEWLRTPWRAIGVLALIATVAWHAQLGVQVVVEDYVHTSGVKIVALIAQRFGHLIIAGVGALAVLRVVFGA